MEGINRLKVALVENQKTSKWLSEQLGVNPSTVSKWCTNTSQPDIETFFKISDLLGVGLKDLIHSKYLPYFKSE
ncbi:MAG: helix-turn-helix transcriptional regulator [Phocaeicola sp.]